MDWRRKGFEPSVILITRTISSVYTLSVLNGIYGYISYRVVARNRMMIRFLATALYFPSLLWPFSKDSHLHFILYVSEKKLVFK